MVNGVKAWSYSTGSMFKTCKAKFKFYAIDKIKEEDNHFQADGQTKHKIAEYYIKGEVKGTPPEIANFKTEMDVLKNSGRAIVEMDLAITCDYKPTKWNDWDNVWLRSKADVVFPIDEKEIVIIDHKFGKPWGSYDEQMKKYFAAAAAHYPEAEIFTTELWFHKIPAGDTSRIDQKIFYREDLQNVQDEINFEWDEIKMETEFRPNPSQSNCRFCFYAKNKSGHCAYDSDGEI
ncbi:MAG: PD-(D/E)XK nuclease family protein [Thiomicrorhabdus sp.]|nr:PD-(D/E)XK nuclease family protein [Thiomicrorhabdus sp.]